jgi:hypothetical protein
MLNRICIFFGVFLWLPGTFPIVNNFVDNFKSREVFFFPKRTKRANGLTFLNKNAKVYSLLKTW